MGSSAQNSSGVHWCGRRVRFNEISEKVPKVLEKAGRLWCRTRSGSTGFWRRFRRRFRLLLLVLLLPPAAAAAAAAAAAGLLLPACCCWLAMEIHAPVFTVNACYVPT